MTERIDPFATLKQMPAFGVKPKGATPIEEDAIETIAREHRFPSRQAKKEPSTPRRKPRLHRTGRSFNFSVKTTLETRDRFYKAADSRGVTLARLMELALDALERAGEGNGE
jgi:hypothetical protein